MREHSSRSPTSSPTGARGHHQPGIRQSQKGTLPSSSPSSTAPAPHHPTGVYFEIHYPSSSIQAILQPLNGRQHRSDEGSSSPSRGHLDGPPIPPRSLQFWPSIYFHPCSFILINNNIRGIPSFSPVTPDPLPWSFLGSFVFFHKT